MIDTRSWKNYMLGDLFELVNSKAYHNKDIVEVKDENGLLYVTRSKFNNGIKCKVEKKSEYIINPAGTISFGAENADFFYQKKEYITGNKMYYINTCNISELAALFLKSVLEATFTKKFSFSNGMVPNRIRNEIISLPAMPGGQPDWAYMESYMKKIMEESEKSLENLKKSNCDNHLINIKGWGEFCLKDLFNKKTMKGFPKKAESYEENPDGYHVFGQSIQYQYSRKVILDKKYLHVVNTNYPILAYASSVGEIGMIDESFYRSGDNGAFQGLFPKTQMNKFQILFLLSILKQEFKKFRYDTSMTDTMMIKFKLPVTSSGDPDLQYMGNYMKKVMKKSEQEISALRAVV